MQDAITTTDIQAVAQRVVVKPEDIKTDDKKHEVGKELATPDGKPKEAFDPEEATQLTDLIWDLHLRSILSTQINIMFKHSIQTVYSQSQ